MSTATSRHTGQFAVAPKKRDVRLDFFRGIGMFIIFFAHMPGNAWTNWIPARFGFSDATEIFVFCSGMASAIAFGKLFEERSFFIGCTRIAYRCWQVYWAHVSIFVFVAALLVAIDDWSGTGNAHIATLNLLPFFEKDTATNLLGFLTLTYVPNYFDILPMYLVILAMIPIVMALARVHIAAVFAFMACVWLLANIYHVNLPAEPWSDRSWFFNPFGWQLIFFTGFAFIRGWIPAPPIDRRLMVAALVVILAAVPLAWWPLASRIPGTVEVWNAIEPLRNKTNLGLFRFVHFLALAYLAYALAGDAGHRLSGQFVAMCCKVGQQALGVFMAGLALSQLGGVALNIIGRNFFTYALVNLSGCAILVAVAYTVAYFKGTPWLKHRHTAKPALPQSSQTLGGERQTTAPPAARPAE